ncbi:Ig-like domain-containing protein [Candidatus Poriferisocius sp.]|uniref:Ig-like domain-containing protein n=1 Tax=Candidatus Poriferisocius sp. TaxID=3101276 RepID=UPI003B01E3E0
MKLGLAAIVAVSALLLGLAATPGDPVSAQGLPQQSVAQQCFEHHRFGAEPVDVAKTADLSTVLAQTSWNWHDTIGCYLSLDQQALAVLRAAPPPQDLPAAPTDASRRCFEHHKFGENPVDVAKTADGQTVLARLSWGYHSTFGCYLVLDDTALTTLRATAQSDPSPDPTPNTDDTGSDDSDTDTTDIEIPQASPRFTLLATGVSYSCAIRTDQTIACWGNNRYGQIDAPPGQYTTIALGNSHSCAITTDQTIACWGNNRYGQADAPEGQYTTIAVGSSYSCAIKADQTIACWGNNRYGQADAPEGQYTSIAASDVHSCAIRVDQTITCWGYNRNGQADAPPDQFAAMAIGDTHSCAIGIKGSIACWGNNRYGQTDAPSGRYTTIATGNYYSCAIRTDQTIACWGYSEDGRIDAPPGQYTAITAGDVHTCAIKTDHTITCWGYNQDGQADAPPGQYTAIAASAHWHGSHSCAIGVDQSIACWGYDQDGESSVPIRLRTPPEELLSVQVFSDNEPKVGRSFEVTVEFNRAVSGFDADDMNVVNGDVTHFSGSGSKYEATVTAAALGTVVVLIPRAAALDQNGRSNEPSQPFARTVRTTASTASAIASGKFHSCHIIKADQTIACGGTNESGQTDAPAGQYTAVAAGSYHSCAIRTDQTIACWGSNRFGQADAPAGQYTAVAAGDVHSCAIKTDQTITCWGTNYLAKANVPAGQFIAVAAGSSHSCAIRVDQTIACWGYSEDDRIDAPAGHYTAIAAGDAHTCAIKTDQTIACWGSNDDWEGNYTGQADAPPGQYTAIAAGDAHTCAIKTDQTIACWGTNRFGQTDAPAGQYTAIATGNVHTCAIKTDQTIACWGSNAYGRSGTPPVKFTVITPSGYSFGSQSCGIRADQTIACWTHDESDQPDASPGPFVAIATPDDEFFDTWDRDAARASAFAEFHRKEPGHDWTGDIDNCVAGTTSQPYRDSIFQRMNWYRQMAGSLPLVEDPELSWTAQAKALILAAEGQLSHFPSPDWACYPQDIFFTIPTESIALASGLYSIDLYMRDPGPTNKAVGHRRMIIDGNSELFGTGDIPGRANTLLAGYSSGRREIREQRGFVAWPSPGYVPPAVNWGRWSFDLSDAYYTADFSTASVEVSDDFGPVETDIIYRHSSGIVWAMDGDTDSYLLIGRRPLHSLADSNYCYTVTISGVKINDSVQTPYEYAVCVLTR